MTTACKDGDGLIEQYEVNQEENGQDEVDGMKKGADSTGNSSL